MFYGRKSYRFRTTWGLKVIDDKFLFQVNDPFKWKVSRVGLCVISGHLSFQQLLRCFSIPYCLSPTAAVHCGRHLAGCSRDCCAIWPLQLPFVPTNKSNSDYVIVCLPCRLPLIQILTLLLSSLSLLLSLCPSLLLLNAWLQCIISLIGSTFQRRITPPLSNNTLLNHLLLCCCDHLVLFQLSLFLREDFEWNILAKKQRPNNLYIKKKQQLYWLYEEYANRSDQYALWNICTIMQYMLTFFLFFPLWLSRGLEMIKYVCGGDYNSYQYDSWILIRWRNAHPVVITDLLKIS